jgi:aspartate ammonia-lyase
MSDHERSELLAPQTVEVATTRSIELSHVATRSERDLLGNADVPDSAYWGIHTLRAVE